MGAAARKVLEDVLKVGEMKKLLAIVTAIALLTIGGAPSQAADAYSKSGVLLQPKPFLELAMML